MSGFEVASEIGRLRRVLLHRPDLELRRLTPSNVHELLFDELLWVEQAQTEHDQFAALLRDHGVDVHLLGDLLAQVLADPGVRAGLLDKVVTPEAFGEGLVHELREWFDALPAPELVRWLIGGVLTSDLPFKPGGLVGASFHPTAFVLPPLPSQMFMRDSSAWMYGGVSINPMALPARRRETVHLETAYRHHPMFTADPVPTWYGGDGHDHYPAVVEGGDMLVLGDGVLLVGMGERTTHQGIEALARSMFAAGALHTLIAVELPKQRAFMHLDTVMTQVDRDAFVAYPGLRHRLRPFVIPPARAAIWTCGPKRTCSRPWPGCWACPRSGPSRPAGTRSSPSGSSGTTATTCSRCRPGWCSPTSATPTPTSACVTRASRSSP